MMTGVDRWCESCEIGGPNGNPERIRATRHATNPNWSGYDLCDDCVDYYDALPWVGAKDEPEEE